VSYTVSSRGRPIGTTDLGFFRIDACGRSGWFHPNALGEQLMPTIASVLPAMRAFISRDSRDSEGRSLVQPEFLTSTLFADLAEAFQRFEALELRLHRPDGATIATTQIGIQDTELELAGWNELHARLAREAAEDEWEEQLERDVAHDLELVSWVESDDADELDDGPVDAWIPDDAFTRPRYQVHVMLAEASAIP
jgi:hypothetical protein